MTVLVSKPAVNLRSELASLRNQGGYQEQQFYLDGLITNGTFETTSGWNGIAATTDSQWYIDNGRLTKGGTNGTAAQIVNPLISGQSYKVEIDVIARPLGDVRIGIGDVSYTITSTLGTQSVVLSPTDINNGIRLFTGGAGGGGVILDNLYVFEVDANGNAIYTMPKGWVPKDVYEDGLLQREGAAYDYEVIYDGFDYKIKSTVAPSATTQTCVIGVKA